MDKYNFVEYWLNPEIIEDVNSKISKYIQSGYTKANEEDIEFGKNLLRNGEVEKAYNYFENKYATEKKRDYQNYCVAILQNFSLNNMKLEENLADIFFYCIKQDLFSGGLDSKIYYDATKSHIEVCNRERRMPDIVAVVKGFRYAAYLGYESAFDEIINICQSNSLPNVEKEWAEVWKQMKEYGVKDNTIYLEVQNILSDAKEVVEKLQVNSINTEKVSVESICNEFLLCHNEADFLTPNKMIKHFGISNREKIYIAHDDTLFLNGKNGFIVTDCGIYCKGILDKDVYFASYADLALTSSVVLNGSEYFADGYKIAYYSRRDNIQQELLHLLENIVQACKNNSNTDNVNLIAISKEKQLETKICPDCKKQVEISKKFCSQCGYSFIKDSELESGKNAPNEKNDIEETRITYCRKCGNTIKTGGKFCSQCGTSVY